MDEHIDDQLSGKLFQRQKRILATFFRTCFGWIDNTFYGRFLFSTIIISIFVFGFIFICSNVNTIAFITGEPIQESDEKSPLDDSTDEYPFCNVAMIDIFGAITTYNYSSSLFGGDEPITTSRYVVDKIESLENKNNIKMILIMVDSGGGSPVAGEEIMNALIDSKYPSVSIIRQLGASAAYWATIGSSHIIASKNSDVGSIGVTSSYLQKVDKNKIEGYEYISLSTGKFKETGNPDKKITKEEQELAMKDLNTILDNFIDDISDRRKISEDKIREIADGRTFLGERAKDLGLIDEVGGIKEAKAYIKSIIGEEAVICGA